ncbi:MAG: hypothetical protein V5B34_03190 [Accumulibacter sp.]|jgi:hypothetical protein
MGEWMQRAALIQSESTAAKAEKSESAVLQPNRAASTAPEPDYQRYPDRYEFPRFVIPTADGPVEVHLAVPKENYDAFAILDLFIKHHGPQIAASRD